LLGSGMRPGKLGIVAPASGYVLQDFGCEAGERDAASADCLAATARIGGRTDVRRLAGGAKARVAEPEPGGTRVASERVESVIAIAVVSADACYGAGDAIPATYPDARCRAPLSTRRSKS